MAEYGTGKSLWYIVVHEADAANTVIDAKAFAFWFFMGSIVVASHLFWDGKRKPPHARSFSATCKFFNKNSKENFENVFKVLDNFFVILFFVPMNVEGLNSARRVLLTQSVRSLENNSPTAGSLKELMLSTSLELYEKLGCLKKNLICQDGVGPKLKTHLFLFGVNFLMHQLLPKS